MPFKITLGNFLEALERGADTIFMAAGARKCRFGYYHYLHEAALRRTGYDYRLVPVSQYSPYVFLFRLIPSAFGVSPTRVIRAVCIMFGKSRLTEEFRHLLNRKRAVEFDEAERLIRPALDVIDRARSMTGIRQARRQLKSMFAVNGKRPDVRMGLVGEIYYMMEQYANQEIEKELGRLGVEVLFERSLCWADSASRSCSSAACIVICCTCSTSTEATIGRTGWRTATCGSARAGKRCARSVRRSISPTAGKWTGLSTSFRLPVCPRTSRSKRSSNSRRIPAYRCCRCRSTSTRHAPGC